MTQLVLVRHGQTDWNAARRYQGHTDIPLNPLGIQQAEALAQTLSTQKFDALYASDLSRAAQTAGILAAALGMTVHTDMRLREINKGLWEGMSIDEVRLKYAEEFDQDSEDPVHSRTPGGETVVELAARMSLAAEEIAQRHPNGRVLVVSHGLAVSALYCLSCGIPLAQVYQHIPENAVPLLIEWNSALHEKNPDISH